MSAQDDEPPSRSISSLDFQTQRPKTNAKKGAKSSIQPKPPVSNQKRRKNIAVVTNPGRRYDLLRRVPAARPRNSQTSVTPSKTGKVNARNKPLPLKNEKIGVTFWRLREPESYERDDAPTFPVKTRKGVENWTAERVSSTTKFKINSLVRFTIESPRSGFLYVVNREVYADGTRGEAKLIFPDLPVDGSANTSVGNNKMRVIRGGSWNNFPTKSRSTFREPYPANAFGMSIGFRVVAVQK